MSDKDYGVPEQYAFHVEEAFEIIKKNLKWYWEEYLKHVEDDKLDMFVPQRYYTPILLIGPPGIAKCVTPDTEIIIIRNNIPKVVPIKDVKVGDKVITITKDLEYKISEVKDVIKMQYNGMLVKIKTRTGRTVKATPFHSFAVLTNGKLETKKGEELVEGHDVIPVFRGNLPVLITEIPVPSISDNRHTNTIKMKKIPLTKEIGFLFGAYLAEGYCRLVDAYEVTITNSCKKFIDNVTKALDMLGLNYSVENIRNTYVVRITSKQFAELINKYFGRKAENKFIDPIFYFAPEEFKLGLLSGYFSGDGNITIAKTKKGYKTVTIDFITKSRKLLETMTIMLASVNIGVSIQKINKVKEYGEYYRCYIFDKKEFIEKIEIVRDNINNEMLKEIGVQEHSVFEKVTVPYEETIKIPRKLGLWTNKVKNRTYVKRKISHYYYKMFNRRCITREGLINFINFCLENAVVAYDGNELEEIKQLRRIAESTVVFDEIKEIEFEYYSGEVYDLEVDESHTYMLANGIFVHNSSLVFETAKELTIELGLPYYEEKGGFISPIKVIDLRLSQILPEDLKGLPKFSKMNEEEIVRWVLPEFLPRKGMGILFLDELNLAPPAVQKAAYSLICERRLGGTLYTEEKKNEKIIFKPERGRGYVLPKGWVIIAAQNPEEQAQIASPIPPPLVNRFRILWVIPPRLGVRVPKMK